MGFHHLHTHATYVFTFHPTHGGCVPHYDPHFQPIYARISTIFNPIFLAHTISAQLCMCIHPPILTTTTTTCECAFPQRNTHKTEWKTIAISVEIFTMPCGNTWKTQSNRRRPRNAKHNLTARKRWFWSQPSCMQDGGVYLHVFRTANFHWIEAFTRRSLHETNDAIVDGCGVTSIAITTHIWCVKIITEIDLLTSKTLHTPF